MFARHFYCTPVLAALAVAGILGCGGQESSDRSAPAASSPDRQPPVPVQQLSATHILLQYQGSPRARDTVTRTRDEALQLGFDLAKRARAGEDITTLAYEYSDGPLRERGGNLGVFYTHEMPDEFSRAVLDMEVGEISDPVETPFGFHVIQRKKVEMVSVRHLVVAYHGAERADASVTRSRAEASQLCEQLLARAHAGEDFAELIRQHSDGVSRDAGGDIGAFHRGSMAPEFEEAAFGATVGEIVGCVETAFGFHILRRYE